MYRPVTGICMATVLFVCSALGFPVPPASPPPATAALVLGAGGTVTIAAGGTLGIAADGFEPGAGVTVALYSTAITLAEVVADGDGRIATTVVLPADVAGEHTIAVLGVGSGGTGRSLQAPVRIAAPPSNGVGVLARTGLRVARWTLFGIGLLVLGLVLVRTSVMSRPLYRR